MTKPLILDPEQTAMLRSVVTEACVEMFTSLGFVVRLLEVKASTVSRAHQIAGFIGFAGAVRGSLMLAGPRLLFSSTSPLDREGATLPESDLLDWTGEMANQLLGRIKVQFCHLGRDFYASTPTAIGGRELGRHLPQRADAIDLVFWVGGAFLSICFEVTPPLDGKLFPAGAKPIPVAAEGALELF